MARKTPGLPSRLTLPSGRKLGLRVSGDVAPSRRRGEAEPQRRGERAPLFSEVLAVLDDGVVSIEGLGEAGVRGLPLGDFHVLRAVLTKARIVHEEELEITCGNCGEPLRVHPCESLEIGPWVDGELADPELDATAKHGEPRDVPPIALGETREARTVTFAPLTVGDALPLFAAIVREPLDVTPELVRAMGIAALGPEVDPARIADALSDCEEDSFDAVTDAFLDAYYPLRLGSVVFCTACKARNDVDAPSEREFVPSAPLHDLDDHEASLVPLPAFEQFAERAHAIAAPMFAEVPGDPVELVVEGGTAAVDDGGEPLLGSYEPPTPKDAAVIQQPPRVTVYYRTFRAIEDDEGAYDWEAELVETIEHELEHHVYFLRGDDPMDAQERAEIDREARRVVGHKETDRRAMKDFGGSVREFFVRAWPLIVLGLIALAVALWTQR